MSNPEAQTKLVIFQLCTARAKEVYTACMEKGKSGSPQGAIKFDCVMKHEHEMLFCTHELKNKFGTTS